MGSMGHSGSRAKVMRQQRPQSRPLIDLSVVDTYPQSNNYGVSTYGTPRFGANTAASSTPPTSLLSRLLWNRRNRQKPASKLDSREESTSPLVFGYPLERYRAELVNLIRENPVTIVSAPTGTGKSTLLPLFLLEEGFRVVSTNPRRAPCEENGRRVAFLHDSEVGEHVGFRHGKAKELSRDAQAIFATEGYEWKRLLHSRTPITDPTVYILDELHENTQEGHAILALLKERIERGEPIKIVVTSATIAREPFAKSFATMNVEPAFFEIPDTQKPIIDIAKGTSLVEDVLRGNKSTLVFVPGKRQIEELTSQLEARSGGNVIIFGLHGEMPRSEQREAINYQPEQGEVKIIVATKIAQSSLTPLGMERVICTGFDRFEELDDEGVRSLVIREDSQNMYNQKRGRVGRTAPGEFIYHGWLPYERLPHSDMPQMQSQPVDRIMLDIAAAERDFEKFNSELLYPAPAQNIQFAKDSLYSNNLIGPQGHITHLGRAVANLPLSIHSGIVVAKAQAITEERDLKPEELLLPAIGVAAVMEAKGILSREARMSKEQCRDGRSARQISSWKRFCVGEIDSDVVAQMQFLEALLGASEAQLENVGAHVNHFHLARDTRRDVCERLSIDPDARSSVLSTSMRQLLMESLYAQYDRWWRVVPSRRSSDKMRVKPVVGSGGVREVVAGSLVSDEASFVVGEPINIENEPYDSDPSRLLVLVSPIPVYWIRTHTPPAQVQDDIREALTKVMRTEPTYKNAYRPNYAKRRSFGGGRR